MKSKMYFLFLFLFIFAISLNAQLKRASELCSRSKIESLAKFNKASQINYPGDQTIDVTYYKLDIALDYTNQNLTGSATIKLKALEDNFTNFYLDLATNMNVSSVMENNTQLAFSHIKDDDKLEITLSKTYPIRDEISINVRYNGNPASDSGFGSFVFYTHEGAPIIWTLSEPYGAKYWFPCKNTPADKADSTDVWITADDYFVSVSNGILEDEINNGNGTKTYKWKNRYPIAQYLISLAMTNYQLYTNNFEYESGKSMEIFHYNYPERWNDQRKAYCDDVIPMLKLFSEKFGPYPFLNEKYGHAEFSWGGAMEHQTISTMSAYYESIMPHELAHQWFGDKITCADWHNIWLNEGFATYSEALIAEERRGYWENGGYISTINKEKNDAKNAIGTVWVQDITDVSEIFNNNRSYAKGAVILHMLRGVVGTETFFKILHQYLLEPKLSYNSAVTEDFQEVAERVYGNSLEYFFQEWVYGENYPIYSIDWGRQPLEGNQFQVQISLEQSLNNNPKFFTMPIEFRIKTSEIDTVYTFFNDQQKQEFYLTVKGKPEIIEFDPNEWLLKELESITSVEISTEIKDYKLQQNYPNPFNPETIISYRLPETSHVSITIYDILGNKIKELVNENQINGIYNLNYNASQLASGIYIYNLTAIGKNSQFSQSKKMILMK